MSDRQFIQQYYPEATLEYMVNSGGGNTRTTSYYRIRSVPILHSPDKKLLILGEGDTRISAWRNTKKNIQDEIKLMKDIGMDIIGDAVDILNIRKDTEILLNKEREIIKKILDSKQ